MSKYLEDQPAFTPQKPVIEQLPANILEMGTEAKPYDLPIGPYWDPTLPINVGRNTTFTDTYISGVYVDALIMDGLLKPNDRSDRALVWKAVQKSLDIAHKKSVIESARSREKLIAGELSSWGMGQGR